MVDIINGWRILITGSVDDVFCVGLYVQGWSFWRERIIRPEASS
jgi:hypothetical protein